ncbi:MAG: hypothetical protein ACOX1P_31850 [Thermoguttaceae bacterium]|jgi:hypothetical protein
MLGSAFLVLAAAMVGAQPVEPNVPKEAIASLGYYVGEWRGTWTEDGVACVSEFTTRWVRGKYCTILTGAIRTPKGISQTTLLSGWEALNKEIVDFSYSSDGSHSIERWKIMSPTLEIAKSTGVSADGQATSSTCRIEKNGQDRFTQKITDRKEGNQTKPDIVIEYVKSAKTASPAKK